MSMEPIVAQTESGVTPAMTFLFAMAGAVAVGNLYWSQPLLAVIAGEFRISVSTAGFLVTLTQLGYALGILLLVPIGDIANRRLLIPSALVATALVLFLSASAPGFAILLLSMGCIGLATSGGQMLPPFAGDLATPEQRGRVVGTIASGMLTGVLLSRSISGLIADAFGWRAVFAVAAVAALIMAVLLRRFMPNDRRRPSVSYGTLLQSVANAVRNHSVVRATLMIGASCFAVFSIFWTGITFLLTTAPFDYSLTQVGFVGLAGLAGAVAARNAGRLHDRGLAVPAQGIALAVTLACLALSAIGGTSIVVIIIVVIVIDGSIQTVNVLNQVRLMNVDPQARSRLNSAFVTSNFIGGAMGSAMASLIWPVAGWNGLMALSSVLIVLAAAVWLLRRRHFERI